MVPYSVNVRVRKTMIYCVVINKDIEMSYFTEKNVKQIIEWERNDLQNKMYDIIQFFITKREKQKMVFYSSPETVSIW